MGILFLLNYVITLYLGVTWVSSCHFLATRCCKGVGVFESNDGVDAMGFGQVVGLVPHGARYPSGVDNNIDLKRRVLGLLTEFSVPFQRLGVARHVNRFFPVFLEGFATYCRALARNFNGLRYGSLFRSLVGRVGRCIIAYASGFKGYTNTVISWILYITRVGIDTIEGAQGLRWVHGIF